MAETKADWKLSPKPEKKRCANRIAELGEVNRNPCLNQRHQRDFEFQKDIECDDIWEQKGFQGQVLSV